MRARRARSARARDTSPRPLLPSPPQAAHEKGLVNTKVAWASDKAYGVALKAFTENKTKASTAALFSVQGHFAAHGFPIGEKGLAVLAITLKVLYDEDVIYSEAFNVWRNDIRNPTPGHDKALMQGAPCVRAWRARDAARIGG